MSKNSLFDLNELDDIPDKIKQDLSKDEFAEQLVKLLTMAGRPLNLDELTVGYYRVFKKIKTKKQIMTKTYNMHRSKYSKIEAVPHRKGVYRLRGDEQ